MDNISSSTSLRSRFRARDQTSFQELIFDNQVISTNDDDDDDDDELVVDDGQTTPHYSSVSSDGEDDPELESMTAKGIKNLCSELLELKNESDEDFRMSISSNYSAFLRIFGQVEGLESELIQLKLEASTHKRIIEYLKESISLKDLSEEMMEPVFEESMNAHTLSPSLLEAHTEDVSEILEILLSEHRLDEALSVLEMEGRAFQSMHFGENFSSDELMSYNSAISGKRAVLSDQFTLLAKNPRVSASELQKALVGLCKLGNAHLALQLLFDYYHARIKRVTQDFHPSREFLNELCIREVARYVFSMISQAARSFVGLHGEDSSYAPELIQWTSKQTQVFAAFLTKYIESVTAISGGLPTAVEAVQCALSYCSLLENQKLVLKSCLIDHVRPRMEQILQIQVNHYKKVISIFTSTDVWNLGRYLASGVLSKGSSFTVADKKPEYCLLTNSGRKFLTLLQGIIDDSSPLVALQMEAFLLREFMELFTEYIIILEEALTTGENRIDKNESRIHPAESLIQGVSVIANSFTLTEFFPNIIRSAFGNIDHLKFEIDSYERFIQETHVQLRAHFFQKVKEKLFSSEDGQTHAAESCINLQNDSDIFHLVPSVPYQGFYVELRKLQKFAEDGNIEVDWLVDLLRELMEAIFVWISNTEETLTATENLLVEENCTSLMQFIVDMQFLVEIARNGGYMSDDIVNASMDILARIESGPVSAQFSMERYAVDWRWAMDAATLAIQKLEELDENESSTHEIADNVEGEMNECESPNSIDLFEDEGDTTSSMHSFESPKDLLIMQASQVSSRARAQTKMSETEENPLEGESFDDWNDVGCFEPFKERLNEIERDEKNLDNPIYSSPAMHLAVNEAEEAPLALDDITSLHQDGLHVSKSLALADEDINEQQNSNVENNRERASADLIEDREENLND